MHLYYSFTLAFGLARVGEVGGFEAGTLVSVEPTLKYHPCVSGILTAARKPGPEQCVAGSLTGAVAS